MEGVLNESPSTELEKQQTVHLQQVTAVSAAQLAGSS